MLFAILLASAIVPGGAFHDSLNFIVGPNAKQCFYEEFADASTVKTIDVFVQSGGLHAIGMQISGPLSVEEVRKVSIYLSARVALAVCRVPILSLQLFDGHITDSSIPSTITFNP